MFTSRDERAALPAPMLVGAGVPALEPVLEPVLVDEPVGVTVAEPVGVVVLEPVEEDGGMLTLGAPAKS